MAPKRIRIELFPNLDHRRFHVTAQVSAERQHAGTLGGDRHDPFRAIFSSESNRELTADTKATIMKFYDVEGVVSVGVDHNTVEITRQAAYDWPDFTGELISTIKEIVGWVNDDVSVEYLLYGKTYDHEPLAELEAEIARQRAKAAAYERSRMF